MSRLSNKLTRMRDHFEEVNEAAVVQNSAHQLSCRVLVGFQTVCFSQKSMMSVYFEESLQDNHDDHRTTRSSQMILLFS